MNLYDKHLFHHKFNLHLIRDILIQEYIKYTQYRQDQNIIYMMRDKHNKYLSSHTSYQLDKNQDKLHQYFLLHAKIQ